MTTRGRSIGQRAALTALAVSVALAITGCGEPSTAQRVTDTMRRAEGIRGLAAARPVPYRFIGQDAAFDEMLADWAISDDAEETSGEALVLERLGLLPDGFDILGALDWSTRSGVIGYYDPASAAMTIVSDGQDIGARELMVVAHEHAHALQDQHHGLEARTAAVDDDEAAALDALIEGEATLVMAVWMVKRLGVEDLESIAAADLLTEPMPVDTVPAVLLRAGEFPYVDGATFVFRRWRDGGWEAVDALWHDPPRSSEQIMHPERYPDDVPESILLPDLAAALGQEWQTDREMTLGEMTIGVLVADGADWPDPEDAFAYPKLRRARAAAGWGGDRLAHLVGPQDSWVVAWQTTWDEGEDADEFVEALTGAFADLPYTWGVLPGVDVSTVGHDHPVLVLVADGAETYRQALRTLAGGAEAS